jgi:hypothetical protein
MDMRTRMTAHAARIAVLATVMLLASGTMQTASASLPAPTLQTLDWAMVNADTARFHVRWINDDPQTATAPTSGSLVSQEFAAFVGDYLTIGMFDLPAMDPGETRDLYFDKAVSSLPPEPLESVPFGGAPTGWPCPQDSIWSGGVHVRWDSAGGQGSLIRHIGHLMVDPGAGASFIRMSNTSSAEADWEITGLTAGFEAALVADDRTTPAPSPLPAGWTGYIAVSSPAATPDGESCCFGLALSSNKVVDTLHVCATTCSWPGPHAPTLETIEWAVLGTDSTRFHVRWTNPDALVASASASGSLVSQYFGAFGYDYLTLGMFDVPALAPGDSLDFYYDVATSSLPVPPAAKSLPHGGPPAGWPCQPEAVWDGSVHVRWDSLGVETQAARHVGTLLVDPGHGASFIRLITHTTSTASWTLEGVSAGFEASLLEDDKVTPAPNPLPAAWTGYLAVSSPSGTPDGQACSLRVVSECAGAIQSSEVLATTCGWPGPHAPTLETIEWAVLDTDSTRFHVRWTNPDTRIVSQPASGALVSQYFGTFGYDYLTLGMFDVPTLAPGDSLDFYYDVATSSLPVPPAAKSLPHGGPPEGWPCRPESVWDGSVHVRWDSLGVETQAARHVGTLLVDPGEGASFIRLITHTTSTASWTIEGVSAGFAASLLEDDKLTPAPNPLPAAWTGYLAVSSPSGTPDGQGCSLRVVSECAGAIQSSEVLATTCSWPGPHTPTLETIEWAMASADTVRFHLHWANLDARVASEPISGTVASQYLGAFTYDYLSFGAFDLPELAPGEARDFYYEKALSDLAPEPPTFLPYGGPPAGWPCPEDTTWSGSVHVRWDSLGVEANRSLHVGRLMVDPGAGPSLIHVITSGSTEAAWAPFASGTAFEATLVGEDRATPAPNPLPAGWTGFVAISSPLATADGESLELGVALDGGGPADTIRVHATACGWPGPHAPKLEVVDWTMLDADTVNFHLRWSNPDARTATETASGSLVSQYLGAFAYDYLTIGTFEVPALEPLETRDFYFHEAVGRLPGPPATIQPLAGQTGASCVFDTTWSGSVHVRWDSLGNAAGATRHVGHLMVVPGIGASLIRVVSHCTSPATWSLGEVCDGFEAQLVGDDMNTAAPAELPAEWTGYVRINSPAGTLGGLTCHPKVAVTWGGAVDTIEIFATTCDQANAGVEDETAHADFGIRSIAPNPARGMARIRFGLPRATTVHLCIVDVTGKRVRTLIEGERAAGIQDVAWDGRGENGAPVAPGVYFLSLRAEGRASNKSVILLR